MQKLLEPSLIFIKCQTFSEKSSFYNMLRSFAKQLLVCILVSFSTSFARRFHENGMFTNDLNWIHDPHARLPPQPNGYMYRLRSTKLASDTMYLIHHGNSASPFPHYRIESCLYTSSPDGCEANVYADEDGLGKLQSIAVPTAFTSKVINGTSPVEDGIMHEICYDIDYGSISQIVFVPQRTNQRTNRQNCKFYLLGGWKKLVSIN